MPYGLFKQFADVLVVQVIDDVPAVAPADDKPEMPQHPKLMRHRRGCHPDGGSELVHRRRTSLQLPQDAQPARSRERLHRLGDLLRELAVKL